MPALLDASLHGGDPALSRDRSGLSGAIERRVDGLHARATHGLLVHTMGGEATMGSRRFGRLMFVLGGLTILSGCYAGVFANQSQGGGTEAALGEEHEMNFPASDVSLLTQDALRGDGVLFEIK